MAIFGLGLALYNDNLVNDLTMLHFLWQYTSLLQDAHELFQAIMNLLHSGEGNPYSSGLDVIDTEDNKEVIISNCF